MQGSRRWTSHCIFLCPTSCGIVGHKPDQEMPGKWTIDQLLDKQIIFFLCREGWGDCKWYCSRGKELALPKSLSSKIKIIRDF